MVNIRDAYANQRFNPEFDRLTDFRTHNVLCIPVVDRRGRAAGAIQVDNKIEGVFDDEDMRVLRAIASQIGVSVLLHS